MPCEGEWIVSAFDDAASETMLLIVSGGNEIACGPQRSMARLARMIADRGWSVLRFDRRGIGDSGGENGGFRSSAPDIRAAQIFLLSMGAKRVVAFGNCDAATALAIHPIETGEPLSARSPCAPIVARILANPWLGDRKDDLPPAAAIKRHYRQRLLDPTAWRALLNGRIDLSKLRRGLGRAAGPVADEPLAGEIAAGLRRLPIPTRIVVASDDATGATFEAAWRSPTFDDLRDRIPLDRVDSASHGFTGDTDLGRLADILVETLRQHDLASAAPPPKPGTAALTR